MKEPEVLHDNSKLTRCKGLDFFFFLKPLEACMSNIGDFKILNGNGDGIH